MATTLAGLFFTPQGGAWRPPQWQRSPLFMITINGNANAPAVQSTIQPFATPDSSGLYNSVGTLQVGGITTQIYVFDAVLAAEHRQELRVTEFPVQTGAAISDHAYILPAEISLDIAVSEAMQAYASSGSSSPAIAGGAWGAPALGGPWGVGTAFKSATIDANTGAVTSVAQARRANVYQTLLSWQIQRVLMSLTTPLITYNNVMVQSVSPREGPETIAGLRARVVFKQLFLASTQSLPVNSSARPQDTVSTGQGQTSPTAPTSAQTAQYGGLAGSTVPGAGSWSSNSSAPAN